MKFKSIVLFSLLSGNLMAADGESLKITKKLTSEESYKLYEHLNVPEVAEIDGRQLVKRSDNIVCTRTGYYPGDREYECSITLSITKDGSLD